MESAKGSVDGKEGEGECCGCLEKGTAKIHQIRIWKVYSHQLSLRGDRRQVCSMRLTGCLRFFPGFCFLGKVIEVLVVKLPAIGDHSLEIPFGSTEPGQWHIMNIKAGQMWEHLPAQGKPENLGFCIYKWRRIQGKGRMTKYGESGERKLSLSP